MGQSPSSYVVPSSDPPALYWFIAAGSFQSVDGGYQYKSLWSSATVQPQGAGNYRVNFNGYGQAPPCESSDGDPDARQQCRHQHHQNQLLAEV
jgi:hypothetical protein